MLRAVDEVDGAGVYIRNLCDSLFKLDRHNRYVLFYRRKEQAGRYAHLPNVQERVLAAPHKLLWDQIRVPLAAREERLDVLFHHKFSIPLIAPCPTVVQQRGTEYWTMPETRDRFDNWYNTRTIPLYCKRAAQVLTNSDTLAEELNHWVGVPREKMRTVYAAADSRFRRIDDPDTLAAVRRKYELPEDGFFLMVAKGYHRLGYTGGKLYDRKNITGTLRAHVSLRERIPECPPLVIAGPGIAERLQAEAKTTPFDPASVFAPGFIDHGDMPAVYSLATAMVFASYSESFGIPLVEAMECGCPVITSDVGACPEVVADAAVIVAPDDVDGISRAMERLVVEDGLAARLQERGLARAAEFSWEESAKKLLGILREAAHDS
ncbi:glycosyltransferase family 1 protein [soil metagenome]